MSTNWGYTRKFIILKKDFSNMHNYNPKGHGKLELKGIKGNISLSIENAEENNYYNVVLVNNNAMQVIGKVYTEEKGKGKADLALNLQELEAKNFPMDKINGILLLRDSNILLGGYIGKEDYSLENYINSIKLNVQEATIEEQESTVEEPEIVISEAVELPPAPVLEDTIGEYEEETTEDSQEEVEVEYISAVATEPEVAIESAVAIEPEEDITIYHKEAKQPTYEPIEPMAEPELEQPTAIPIENDEVEIDYEHLSAEYDRRISQRNQTTNYILSILRFFPYIDPFNITLQGYNWWKIDYQEGIEERGFLPYFSYLIGGDRKYAGNGEYVTAKDLLRKYEHYIFGLYNVKDEVKYYIYGVPGDFVKSEHPHNGATGFNTWFEGYELDGYWLLYIDPLSGKVIYPANPMEPIN